MTLKLVKIEVGLNVKDISFDVKIGYGKIFERSKFKELEEEFKKANKEYIKKLEKIAKNIEWEENK